MSTRDHYGHVGPDGSQPGERMVREGYRWRAYAENIAAGQRSVAAVMADWIASAGHYANLVNPAYRHVGLGHASTGVSEYGDYWVQDFGRGTGVLRSAQVVLLVHPVRMTECLNSRTGCVAPVHWLPARLWRSRDARPSLPARRVSSPALPAARPHRACLLASTCAPRRRTR